MRSPPASPPVVPSESEGAGARASQREELVKVALYRRTIRASLDRVWENVLDWEHLPWLHRTSFEDIQLSEAGAWGWRARAVTSRGSKLALELLVDRDASRYVSRTVEGEGAGSEIWTQLRGRAPHETDIEVEFLLPEIPPDAVEAVGAAYTRLYTRLWDEDEEMMREREQRLACQRSAANTDVASAPLDLGSLQSLRVKLPLRVEFAGEPFWLVECETGLIVHTAVCPHLLGPLPPLGAGASESGRERDDTLQCPWHGYRFDVEAGASCDGRKLRMRPAPRVVVEGGRVRLLPPAQG